MYFSQNLRFYTLFQNLVVIQQHQPAHFPPEKNGTMYDIMNPRLLSIAHVIAILFSHALDSSTVLPDFEKFIKRRAMDAVTTAATVEIKST